MWGNGGSHFVSQSENCRDTGERHHGIFISLLSAYGWNLQGGCAEKAGPFLPKWLENSGSEAGFSPVT
jgi:hypothetical protein